MGFAPTRKARLSTAHCDSWLARARTGHKSQESPHGGVSFRLPSAAKRASASPSCHWARTRGGWGAFAYWDANGNGDLTCRKHAIRTRDCRLPAYEDNRNGTGLIYDRSCCRLLSSRASEPAVLPGVPNGLKESPDDLERGQKHPRRFPPFTTAFGPSRDGSFGSPLLAKVADRAVLYELT